MLTKQILQVESVNDYVEYVGARVLHPHVAVILYDELGGIHSSLCNIVRAQSGSRWNAASGSIAINSGKIRPQGHCHPLHTPLRYRQGQEPVGKRQADNRNGF